MLEIHKLRVFPVKVEKIFGVVPEYIGTTFNSSADKPSFDLLLTLSEFLIRVVKNTSVRNSLRSIIEKANIKEKQTIQPDEIYVEDFVRDSYQKLVYGSYYINDKYPAQPNYKVIETIDDESSWDKMLNKINKNNLGLTGLAGMALGLLEASAGKARGTLCPP